MEDFQHADTLGRCHQQQAKHTYPRFGATDHKLLPRNIGSSPSALVHPGPGSEIGNILADDPSFAIPDEIHKHLDFREFSAQRLKVLVYILFWFFGF